VLEELGAVGTANW